MLLAGSKLACVQQARNTVFCWAVRNDWQEGKEAVSKCSAFLRTGSRYREEKGAEDHWQKRNTVPYIHISPVQI